MHRFTIVALACTSLAFALGACGDDDKDSSAPTTTTPAATGGGAVQVSIEDIKFIPHDIRVKVGQKILWTNADQAAHNVTATKGANFESETLGNADTFEYTPMTASVIEYVCTIHPGQDGTITTVTG